MWAVDWLGAPCCWSIAVCSAMMSEGAFAAGPVSIAVRGSLMSVHDSISRARDGDCAVAGAARLLRRGERFYL